MHTQTALQSISFRRSELPRAHEILTVGALEFVYKLHAVFNHDRLRLLAKRKELAAALAEGAVPAFSADTAKIRQSDWQVADAPEDLEDRRVEITGPAERKMMINALNSGANVFMADLEDALSPTWDNVIEGQINLMDAVRRELTYRSPEGKHYSLNADTATLVVRPRGWHLEERNVRIHGERVAASLFDFGLYFYHNAYELLRRGSGPYFYLPKLESRHEARLWNDVFRFAQQELGLPQGTVRATVLVETALAAFEMEEILFELREHASGLNAGRWDYLFSMIKKLEGRMIYPDRSQLTMTVPFMQAYSRLLVQSCHRRGAHAIGGMAAYIPSRKDADANGVALTKVREDKDREAAGGFDGTWVAHPDLVPIARAAFDTRMRGAIQQKQVIPEGPVTEADLLPSPIENGQVTLAGVRQNISIALQYLDSWLNGQGAVAIFNLMEDAATAEISRAELWQWVRRQVRTTEGALIDAALFRNILVEEEARLRPTGKRLTDAAELLSKLVLSPGFTEFLTLPAYEMLDATAV